NLFKEKIRNELDVENTPSVKSLLTFLENDPIKQIEKTLKPEHWKKILDENPFVVFKIDGANHNSICDDIRNKTKTNQS
ncbi:MAG: hypothetical protein ACK4UV_04545, partial [Ignavibacterium sp.]